MNSQNLSLMIVTFHEGVLLSWWPWSSASCWLFSK